VAPVDVPDVGAGLGIRLGVAVVIAHAHPDER
jgi:hypothetical protein